MIQFEGIPEINGFCILFYFFVWIFFFFFVEPYLLISGFLDKLL